MYGLEIRHKLHTKFQKVAKLILLLIYIKSCHYRCLIAIEPVQMYK